MCNGLCNSKNVITKTFIETAAILVVEVVG